MVPVILETLLHESLKYSQRIHKAKRYPYPLIITPWSDEELEVMTFRTKMDLMVFLALVEDTKVLALS